MANYIVSSGITSTGCVLSNYNSMTVLDGGVANNTTVNSRGMLMVSSGGEVNDTTVNARGYLHVFSGGEADQTKVNSDGSLYVSSGGTATNIVWTPCEGYVHVYDGGDATFVTNYSGVYFGFENKLMSSAVIMDGKELYNSYEMYVMNTGTATRTTVEGGTLKVSSGGVANNTRVLVNGNFTVSSGGTANSTTVNNGFLNINNGGTANSTKVNESGYLTIFSGGIVNNAIMNGKELLVSSGGKLTGRVICLNGTVSAYEGAMVDFDLTDLMPGAATRINNLSRIQGTPTYTLTVKANQAEGFYALADGAGSFNQTITVVNASGNELGTLSVGETIAISGVSYTLNLADNTLSLKVGEKITPSPYTSNGLFIGDGMQRSIKSNEEFFDTFIFKGNLFILSGGTANSTIIDRGSLHVSSGGMANSITVLLGDYYANGSIHVASDGVVNNTLLNTYGEIFVSGVANNTVIDGGNLRVYSGGTANSTFINYIPGWGGGTLHVSYGGSANKTTVNIGGRMNVSSYGVATEVIENGGYVDIGYNTNVTFAKNAFSGLVLSNASATIHSGTTATNVELAEWGELNIFSGGSATNVIWTPFKGNLNVYGGHVTFASQYSGVYYGSGNTLLSHAVTMDNIIIPDYASMYVMADGITHSTTISGGYFYIFSGGMAKDTTIIRGSLYINSGGVVDNTMIEGDDWGGGLLTVISGGTANNTKINNGRFEIQSGGTAQNTTIQSGGSLFVDIGGIATGITASAGAYLGLDIAAGTFIAGTSDGFVFEINDGKVSEYTINCGHLFVSKDGEVENTIVNGGGYIWVTFNGLANYVVINSRGRVEVASGGIMKHTTVNNSGSMWLSSGGTANSTMLSYGSMWVSFGGVASNTTLNYGSLWVSSSGTANGIMMSGGTLNVSSGGRLTGRQIYLNGTVSAYEGAMVDFDLTDLMPGAATRINNLSRIQGTPTYTLTVKANQAEGFYALADGAGSFNQTITVVNASGNELGTLSVGETIAISGVSYTLNLADNTLSLKVGEKITPSPYTSNGLIVSNYSTQTVASGEFFFDTLVLPSAELKVLSGGTAAMTTVYDNGRMIVSSGGTATGITASPSAYLGLAVAQDTYVSGTVNGSAIEIKDGKISGHAINSGYLQVFSGGTADNTMVSSGGWMYLEGGQANSTIVSSGGNLQLTSGGIANNTEVNDNGNISVTSGCQANGVMLNPNGQMYVYAEGSANNVTVNANAKLWIFSGGNATGIKENGGWVSVENGANVSFVANTFHGLELTNASATIHAGTTANEITLNSNGQLYVYAGGIANDVTANTNGYLYVFSGGKANKAIASSGGNLVVSSGGVADSATVNANGWLTVSSGGTATNVVWTPCAGKIVTEEGAYVTFASQYSGVYYGSGNTLLSSVSALNSATLESYYEMYVMSNGKADSTTVNNAGSLSILSGGTVDNTVVNNGGSVFVSGGTGSNTTIENGGSLFISSGGTMTTTAVKTGGYLYVEIGGIATDITATAGAYLGLDIAAGTFISGTSDGSVFEINDGKVSGYTVNSGYLRVSKDGVANNTTVNSRGRLMVSSGGTASDIVENGGWVSIQEGATATFASHMISGFVLSNTSATIHSGTTANRVSLDRGGRLVIYSGGLANRTTVNSGGSLMISSGGMASRTTLTGSVFVSSRYNEYQYRFSSGCMYVSEGGIADSTKVNAGGFLIVSKGGLTSNTSVCGLGFLDVKSSGVADETTVCASGGLWISKGGIAKNTRVSSGGSLFASEGRITGKLTIAEGAIVSIDSRTVLDFDVSDRTPDTSALINNLSLIMGTPTYTLTVSETQVGGVYTLADEVSVFKDTITVQNTLGKALGKLSLNTGLTIGDTTYTLSLEDSLILTVDAPDRIAPIVSNIQASITTLTNQDVVLTADFADDIELASSLYKLEEKGEWTAYTGSITVSDNTTVFFKAIDAAGNESEVVSYKVNNIDKVAPEMPITEADITTPTNGDVLVMATFSEDSVSCEYSLNGKNWGSYIGGVLFASNRTAYFRSIDAAGNISEVASYTVTNIDRTAPAKPSVSVDVTTPTNQGVSVSATFDEDSFTKEYSLDGEEWHPYTKKLLLLKNETVSFRGTDEAGNVSEVASLEVNNIDTVAPSDPAGLFVVVSDQTVVLVWNVSTDDSGIKEYVVTYSSGEEEFTARTSGTSYVLKDIAAGTWNWSVQAVDMAGNESAANVGESFTVAGFKPYTVEYSADNFEHVIRFTVTTPKLDSFRMPTGTYQLRVMQTGSSEWQTGDSIEAAETDNAPQLIKSDADGNADVFFANSIGTWESGYLAQHVGSINDWSGTSEYAAVFGKNKLADIIEGLTDANILLMTDDENGDALFVDDIYTALPGSVSEQQSRIAQIDEIRAGFGNDIVDMTSQRFEYIGDGLTIRGGAGNDTIWANKGDNWLFGDAGNDRIVGASGNDVIAGGIGNDRMHGGGGNDVFTFCENYWGVDNVEQLAGGSVTLWFASEQKGVWDASSLTYTDGANSVKVSGVSEVTLKFGDDGTDEFAALSGMGAFFDATTERIFEESGKGILVSL